jgi:hypothetical protein
MCVLTVSAGDGADRGEQLLRRVVLEDEAARAGARASSTYSSRSNVVRIRIRAHRQRGSAA